ncbi:hypothetical protein BGX29_009343 [Mortierella sp. GBA35]|nr:hypothetical protein BGX29_009343 [Mortierella sp. GBA35]
MTIPNQTSMQHQNQHQHQYNSHPLDLPEILCRVGHFLSPWTDTCPHPKSQPYFTSIIGHFDHDRERYTLLFQPRDILTCTAVSKLWRQALLPELWRIFDGNKMDRIPKPIILKHSHLFRVILNGYDHFSEETFRECDRLREVRLIQNRPYAPWIPELIQRNKTTLVGLSWRGSLSRTWSFTQRETEVLLMLRGLKKLELSNWDITGEELVALVRRNPGLRSMTLAFLHGIQSFDLYSGYNGNDDDSGSDSDSGNEGRGDCTFEKTLVPSTQRLSVTTPTTKAMTMIMPRSSALLQRRPPVPLPNIPSPTSQPLRRTTRALSGLRELSLDFRATKSPGLIEIVRFCPALESLVLIGACATETTMFNIDRLTGLLKAHCRRLHAIRFMATFCRMNCYSILTDDQYRDLVQVCSIAPTDTPNATTMAAAMASSNSNTSNDSSSSIQTTNSPPPPSLPLTSTLTTPSPTTAPSLSHPTTSRLTSFSATVRNVPTSLALALIQCAATLQVLELDIVDVYNFHAKTTDAGSLQQILTFCWNLQRFRVNYVQPSVIIRAPSSVLFAQPWACLSLVSLVMNGIYMQLDDSDDDQDEGDDGEHDNGNSERDDIAEDINININTNTNTNTSTNNSSGSVQETSRESRPRRPKREPLFLPLHQHGWKDPRPTNTQEEDQRGMGFRSKMFEQAKALHSLQELCLNNVHYVKLTSPSTST